MTSTMLPRVMRTALLWVGCLLLVGSALAGTSLVPKAPETNARAWILQDFQSGRTIAQHNPDQVLEPASLTKMMTAYVVFSELKQDNIKLGDLVLVSEKAWKTPGSRMFIEVDKRVSVEDLLMGVIVQSGNDASVALAEFVAGDETTFVGLMNQHAKRLGLNNTHFVNATGLPDENHYTTANDLAQLARALIRDFPELYQLHAVRKFDFQRY